MTHSNIFQYRKSQSFNRIFNINSYEPGVVHQQRDSAAQQKLYPALWHDTWHFWKSDGTRRGADQWLPIRLQMIYYLNKKTYKTSSSAKTCRMQLTGQISFRDCFFRSLLSQILIPSTAKILSICWGTFPDKSVGSLGLSFFRSGSGGDRWIHRHTRFSGDLVGFSRISCWLNMIKWDLMWFHVISWWFLMTLWDLMLI